MDVKVIRRFHRVAALVFSLALVFAIFFQLSKGGPFREVNPFLEDPYDAVGSFAVQIALLVGLLTYARALRLRSDIAQSPKGRLIVRGSVLVLLAVAMTLASDSVSEILDRGPRSTWGNVLLAELGLMILLTIACGLAVAAAVPGVGLEPAPGNLTPADGIDDLWSLVRVPVIWASRGRLPRLRAWVESWNSDRLFDRMGWWNPRQHAWRFASAVGLLAGIGLAASQLREGLPPSLMVGLLAMSIFVVGEFAGTLLGFAFLGGYLGLRPRLRSGG